MVKKIHKSIKRRLWVIVIVSMGLLSQFSYAQDVDQVKVYDVISNQNICFGEVFEIDTINILEMVPTSFGLIRTSTSDIIVANLKQKPKDLRCFEM